MFRLKCIHLLLPFLLMCSTSPLSAKVLITLQGSTTVYPIAKEAAAAYMAKHQGVEINVEGSGSGHGLKAMIDGTTDIANASRFIKSKEAKMAYEKGTIPIPFRVAYDCIIPVVHISNPIKGLTMDEITAIYSGSIKNWKELGGKDAPIKVLSRDTSSGTYGVWKKMVMGETALTPAVQLKPSNSEIVDALKEMPNGIGYIGIGHLDQTVKALAVDGIVGSESTAVSGRYPITRPLFMFTRGWPTGEIKKFINFMLEPGLGQKYVKKAGYLSVYLPSQTAATPCPKIPPCPEAPPCPEVKPCPPCESKKVEALTSKSALSHKNAPQLTTSAQFQAMSDMEKCLQVQRYLKRLGYRVGHADGIWGKRTLAGYIKFQKANNSYPLQTTIKHSVFQLLESKELN